MLIEKVTRLEWCEEDLKATPNGVDIWEENWRYYFTWEAALREAEAQWLILPSKEEWEGSLYTIWKEKLFDFLKLNNAGYWDSSIDYYQGSYGHYWSSTPNGIFSYSVYFYSGCGGIEKYDNRGHGFSVRCLKHNS